MLARSGMYHCQASPTAYELYCSCFFLQFNCDAHTDNHLLSRRHYMPRRRIFLEWCGLDCDEQDDEDE
ncbi:hypothetical protein CEXT_711151 [Caerostris extrusa]|uniref:Uncharacterized protein n=1 Tax=Caerostris extrusa TaxID=172846 RepID=A0AAV4Y335_CAEEX|nr:hypothetical protein CEXT_711151 [Caerostris extrusa]